MKDKSNTDKLLLLLAKQAGKDMGKELDAADHECNRPELRQQIETLIFEATAKRQKLRKRRALLAAAACSLCVLLLGAAVIHRLPFALVDNQTHSTVIPLDVSSELKQSGFLYCIAIPEHYTFSSAAGTGDSAKAVFTSGDSVLVFTQSRDSLDLQTDTEDAEFTTIMLHSGHEGVYIQKNGASLLWKQGDYYFMLFASDEGLDLVRVASSIQKL